MKNIFFALFFTFFSLSATAAKAQNEGKTKFITFDISPVAYKGDLGNAYSQWGRAFGVSYHVLKAGKFSRGFSFLAGKISGSDISFQAEGDVAPNRSFSTSFYSAQYDLHYNFFKSDNFHAYAGAGAGMFFFTVKDDSGNKLSSQLNTRKKGEDYANISLFLPVKIGGNYYFDNGFGLGFQAGLLNPFTKYLDNIAALGKNKRDNILFAKISLVFKM
jgi:hypothetical protein